MINFLLGVLLSSAFLLTAYFTVFNKKRIRDYRNRDHLKRLISQDDFDFLLIDIREEKKFKHSHLPSAINIPFEKLLSILPVENMFLTIIIYGDNRNRSHKAAQSLSTRGYFNVTSFGSISRWKEELIIQ